MIKRKAQKRIGKLLTKFPVVGIVGPRQVGKTTLVKNVMKSLSQKAVYLDLELPPDIKKLENPVLYFQHNEDRLVVLDEIQNMPSLFPTFRAVIDQHRKPGRFILLGSASPDLMKNSAETLTGRIAYVKLSGLSLSEVKSTIDLNTHWLLGGFPEAVLEKDVVLQEEWYYSFVKTYLERDLPNIGLNTTSPVTLKRFVTMLASNQGGIWNASSYARSLGVNAGTITNYANFLEHTYFIRRLPPFYSNAKKES